MEIPEKCPVCGSNEIARILYGMPAFNEQLIEELRIGKVTLGGCIVKPDNPLWICLNCHPEAKRQNESFVEFANRTKKN
jgi:hypothetical protein